MSGQRGPKGVIPQISSIFPKRKPLWKAILTLTLLVLLIVSLLYPGTFWFFPILGGLVSIIGILFKRKILITSGIVIIGVVFFLSNLTVAFSGLNIIILIALFVLFYAAIVYLNELAKIDMILRDHRGGNETFNYYRKNWNRAFIKNLSLVFLLSLIAFMISWIGSFEFWIGMENIVLLGVSSFFILAILGLLYVLFIKIPSSYDR